MNLSKPIFSLTLCALLTACGGGDDSHHTSPSAQARLANPSDFEGTWLVTPENTECAAEFPYHTPSFHRFEGLVITQVDGMLRASVTADVFSDAACTTKLGRVEEQFDMHAQAGTSAGRTNVIKATFAFTGSTTGADGGSGLTMNQAPDGTMSEVVGYKFLMDRVDDRLYLTINPNGAALDSDGFPTAFDPDDYLTR